MVQPRVHRLAARIRVSTLAALLAIAMLPGAATPTSAAADSDIPGVPLPGSVVTGRLGGPIYDRVYWIDVAPNQIILMSLTGDPGTDFDLYLFDSSATSVYGGIGQVAASTGPTSTESISYAARSGGRYYIDLSGFSEAEGNFRLVVATRSDEVPPNADLQLNGRALATTESTVVVTLVATDDLSGVAEMAFSPDGTTWQDWRPYTPTTLWTFDPADGLKRLWARVRDRSGNISTPAVAGITLDTRRPTVLGFEPGPNGALPAADPTIRVRFSEALDPDSWATDGLIVQDAAGARVPGSLAWNPETNTGAFRIANPAAAGASYVVTVGTVTDLAGNPVAPIPSWIVRALQRHTVSLDTSATVVAYRSTITLTGTVDLPLASSLVLERSLGGGAWTALAPLAVDAFGAFRATDLAIGSARYRVRVAGTPTEAELTSAEVRVLVRRGVALVGHSPTVVKSGVVGRAVSVTVAVTPATPNVSVTLTVARYDTARRAWRTVATTTRISVAGRATFSWRPTAAGSYYLRASTPTQPLFANSVSATYRWTVR